VNGSEARRLFELRDGPADDLAGQADAVAAACHAMAVRFHQGGKLVVFGTGGASTDAQHVAVEFVHPVIVGKRALPAISLTTDVATVTGIAERDGVAAIFALVPAGVGDTILVHAREAIAVVGEARP
jgi:D-sedoheptulose 7-phosphate isomerase